MPSPHPLRQTQTIDYPPGSDNPTRQRSNASTASSASSSYPHSSLPSRTSTISSTLSYGEPGTSKGHKRGISEAVGRGASSTMDPLTRSVETSPAGSYKSMRMSLKPLAQPSNMAFAGTASQPSRWDSDNSSDASKPYQLHQRSQSESPVSKMMDIRNTSSTSSRSDSIKAISPTTRSYVAPGRSHLASSSHAYVTAPDLQTLQRSSTTHFRTLSRLTENGSSADFSISSPAEEVAGLHGRRRLQRTGSIRGARGPGKASRPQVPEWIDRNWMDKQRQFLQAYEYLCHIGEAKEWIEDIIHKPIPPIVQLEEALRDGVTLAEIVQALHPEKTLRIFRNPKLQFRHSDNIALFFRFLAEVELPELFRFELIDLYEKKNIPKVIYCIHALSWLLYRKGIVQFRIGNLVGQLEFEHHELEEMQKGLDKAGITMPSFTGMGASFGGEPDLKEEPEPEPEPVETEEERVERELSSLEPNIVELQAQARGALLRGRLGDMMEDLWNAEEKLVDLQSRIRGEWARQISSYRLDMQRFAINLQSATRGFLARAQCQTRQDNEVFAVSLQSVARAYLVRARAQLYQRRLKEAEKRITMLQSLARASAVRRNVQHVSRHARAQRQGIMKLQAAIRGSMCRLRVRKQDQQAQAAGDMVEEFHALARGYAVRQNILQDRLLLSKQDSAIKRLQSAIRGTRLRQRFQRDRQALLDATGLWQTLQATARGNSARRTFRRLLQQLKAVESNVYQLQGVIRGRMVREKTSKIMLDLEQHADTVQKLQALARGRLLRLRIKSDAKALALETANITMLQAHSRAMAVRKAIETKLAALESHADEISQLQGLVRAMLLRSDVAGLLEDLDDTEESVLLLQCAARGLLVRSRYKEKERFFKENMEKVIKVQSFIRGRLQGEAYKSLTSGKNPPVGTVKGFVHLLNDSDFDFDEEIEFERLRKTVVQHVRQNELAEQYIDQLDIKIALLVKNKITLDEVVKHQRHFGGHVGSLLTNTEMSSKDPFDLKALNKNSRRKLEHYQQLFFVLQTQPQYLARLFRRLREHGTAEKDCRRIEHLMLGLFGYAQKRREEYYLLKLISRSIKEEVECCNSIQDYLRGNFFWGRLLNGYIRSPRDRKYLRDLMGPLVREYTIDSPELDLESDPMQIYLALINDEELQTGRRSQRDPDISREEAIKDPEARKIFTDRLQDLRDIADHFFTALDELLPKMPYGIRYVAQQIFEALVNRFRNESKQQILQIVGQWVWKSYLQPAMTQPETWGIIDRGLTPLQKKNMGEVAKVVGQLATGRLFGGDNVFLQPLNHYVAEKIPIVAHIWEDLISVRDAEAQFDIDEFNDLYARTKPTLYIKMTDIFAVHQLVASEINHLCPTKDDVLQGLVHDLGSAETNKSEMLGVSSAEINLTLNPKLHDVEDPDAEWKSLFMETKRCILYIIRVQSGANLMEILVTPITSEDERRWEAVLHEDFSDGGERRRGAYSESNALVDVTSMTYAELKRTALENILQLEIMGRVSRHNHYQDLLNAIAVDIRTKHRRRIQRQRELEGVRLTLGNLNEKAVWLESQLKSYNDYIEQAMVTLQNKKGKKRFLLPFTKQYNHERELQRSGKVPKFGSFKYSARSLADKGVLVSYQGYTDRQYEKINLTISSDEVGVFFIEGSLGSIQIPGASATVPLDDLLQAQFNNHQFMTLFEGRMRLNVNLFLHLLFRKFYRDE
ncbi:MAG: 40S ribosomal protein S21 [Watsoniomyces obsoletus]|nr:MAG: 40S ribosomal protein S21 [Watsoniomyces obsoletus]